MRNVLKYLGILFGLVIIASLDTAFFPALGQYWLQVNIALIVGLFMVTVFDLRKALFAYLMSTVIIVFTSTGSTFSPIIIGVVSIFFADWLFQSFFTNKSFYTLIALGVIGWLIYYFQYIVISLISHITIANTLNPEITLNWVIGNLFALLIALAIWTIAYMITNYMSIRFKSYFIIGER